MAFRSKLKDSGGLKDPASLSHSFLHLAPLSTASSNGSFNHPSNDGTTAPKTASGPGYTSSKRRLPLRKVENAPITGWLEAMKYSSPPRMRCHVAVNESNKAAFNAAELEYKAWMVNHPSAKENFDDVIKAANGKRVFVFLDYDGTLSPIVENPECAFMTDEMRSVVKEIATVFPTAIITGRSREKVYEFVQLPELYYAGSHGMDIMGPAKGCSGCKAKDIRSLDEEGNEVVLFQPASEFNVMMDEDWLPLAEHVQHVLKSYPNLGLTKGRKVLEVRPLIMWNKGKALDYLLKTLGYNSRNDVFPVYIGDDQTDEDAFKTVVRRKHGLAILVSNVVKETNATFCLRDPSEVFEFLQSLVKWKRSSSRVL